ncbi:MAG: hypothetical protein KF810_16880 [Rhizobiaceae bacterium]|nr:hypothetical protein [Rhizobiaceae bacterium]
MQADYSAGTPTSGSQSASIPQKQVEYWDIGKLRRAYNDYLGNKRAEIDEAKDARRYYHGAQWTEKQIKVLRARNQPVHTDNVISRKIDGVVGVLERMRQDPKAYPRTPQHEEGADLATAVIRYVLDQQEWQPKSSEAARDGAIEGIAGIEIELIQGDQGDPDIGFEIVEPDTFFYDPRSYRADFSDARYMGVSKWMDIELAKEMFPDKEDAIDASVETGTDLTTHPDRENMWYDSTNKHIRLVDCWYKHKGKWCWSIFTGADILMEGESFLVDEKGEPQCKYIMYSSGVDHDGDRYGFVRNLKSPQDSINYKKAKVDHIMASRRLIMTNVSVEDVEVARREWAKPDGVVLVNGGPNSEIKADDQSFDFAGWTKLLELSRTEIENFGPNPAVLGQGVEKQSGRAIQLLQQAGIAELGPYIVGYKGWKVRVYRAIWNAVQRNWTAERWIRVTDDEGLAQFIQVNSLGIDPNTGLPAIINGLGSLDVDIIIDEGPDTLNMQADTYDALLALAQAGAQVPPAVLIELSPGIDSRTKKKVMGLIEQASQPGPEQQLQIAGAQAEIEERKSKTMLNVAKAQEAGRPEMQSPQAPEVPIELQSMKTMAEIDKIEADTQKSYADAFKTAEEARLAPMKARQEAIDRQADRQSREQQFRQRSAA